MVTRTCVDKVSGATGTRITLSDGSGISISAIVPRGTTVTYPFDNSAEALRSIRDALESIERCPDPGRTVELVCDHQHPCGVCDACWADVDASQKTSEPLRTISPPGSVTGQIEPLQREAQEVREAAFVRARKILCGAAYLYEDESSGVDAYSESSLRGYLLLCVREFRAALVACEGNARAALAKAHS